MTHLEIALLIVGAWLVLAGAAGLAARLLGGRGEVAEAPDYTGPIGGADAACDLTQPLEYVPATPDPDLDPYEAEVAGIDVGRLAALYLTNSPHWSNR